MLLRELLDRPYPVALDDPDAADAAYRAVWIWRFTTDQGDQGEVTITRSLMHSRTSVKYSINGSRDRPNRDQLRPNSMRIFSSVLAALRHYWSLNPANQTQTLEFVGSHSDPKRLAFYDRMAQQLGRWIPYRLVSTQDHPDDYKKYVLARIR